MHTHRPYKDLTEVAAVDDLSVLHLGYDGGAGVTDLIAELHEGDVSVVNAEGGGATHDLLGILGVIVAVDQFSKLLDFGSLPTNGRDKKVTHHHTSCT